MKNWLLTGACFLALSGCSSLDTGLEVNEGGHQQALFADPLLAQQIAVDNLEIKKSQDLRQASFKVSNLTNIEQALEYKLYWYDGDGLEINIAEEVWHPLTLKIGQSLLVSEPATEQTAQDFRVQFRQKQ